MADNKVKFLRGTAAEYKASAKDSDVFYYTIDTKRLYLGTNEVTGVGEAGTGENAEIFNDYESNEAYGKYSHAEGLRTHANNFSHAEGLDTQASGDSAHAEGSTTIASGNSAHAEGTNTTASGWYSHAEGYMTIASNMHTHAGGTGSEASKEGSFAHGRAAKASNNDYEVAFGTFNKSNADTLFSIGNGADEDTRSNAFEITKTTGKLFDKEIATKEELEAHTGNADIHVTAAEKAAWNAVNYSNPNLLINPDFRINQRGETSYTAAGYTIDGWYTNGGAVDVTENGVELTNSGTSAVRFRQNSEITHAQLAGRDITLSASVGGTTYSASGKVPETKPANDIQVVALLIADTDVGIYLNYSPTRDMFYTYAYVPAGKSAVLNWVKAEIGSVATQFVPPDPATELAKCQRYYQIRTTNNVDPLDMRPSMRTITDIKQVTGGYAYVAEL